MASLYIRNFYIRISKLFLGFLRRSKRFLAIFEEMKQGNMERECFEEVCNAEENYEVFDRREPHNESWSKLQGCASINSGSVQNLNKRELRSCYQKDTRKIPPPK